ncbi:TetR/AcrR family transcriptional regulator [Streptomyces sp. P9-A2]|uniref:TetR/AcrR family transcriptional regulator n=1 Tax=Streptomyces sp. P9-A2 TaxID=3072284 RepID=UPI003FCDBDE5
MWWGTAVPVVQSFPSFGRTSRSRHPVRPYGRPGRLGSGPGLEPGLSASASAFRATGYTAAGTDAVAREAGVSPGAPHQLFPDKEAVAVELSDPLMHGMREIAGEALGPPLPDSYPLGV